MRSGRLDYETGKWADDEPVTLPDPSDADPPLPPMSVDHPSIPTVPIAMAAPNQIQPSAADKARLMLQRLRGG